MALGDTIASLSTGFGTITYNGVTFNALRQYSFRSEPVYDEAGWTVTHHAVTMRLHCWIMSADVATQQTAMGNLHTLLNQPGRRLQISGLGLDGDVDTLPNGAANPDILWGPKPRIVETKPAGGLLAWEFDWEVTYHINRDATASAYVNGHLMAFNWTADYAVDAEGLTTRTIDGYFTVPQRRGASGSRLVLDTSLEARWNGTNVALPVGFRRISVRRRLSADRIRLDFSIVDQELAGDPFPQGIVDADIEHEFANDPSGGFVRWLSVLSGSLTVAKGYPKALAAQKFFLLLADVAAKARTVAHASDIGGTVIPSRIKFSTQKFGRTSRFFVAFTMAACLEEILSKSGIYQAVPGTNYQQWATSLQNVGVMQNRGVAKLVHTNAQDKIIDLGAAQLTISIGQDAVAVVNRDGSYSNDSLCPQPTEKNSYLHFDNRIQAIETANVIVHRRAQPAAAMSLSPATNASLDAATTKPDGSAGEAAHTVQYSSSTDQLFLMYGSAARLKWLPQVPQLKDIGGVPVEKLAQTLDDGPAMGIFDCPLYTQRWAILYRVKGYAPTVRAPRNKMLCVKAGADDGIS